MTDQFLVVLDDKTETVTRNCGLGGSGCTLGALGNMAKTSSALEQFAQRCLSVHGIFQDLARKRCG